MTVRPAPVLVVDNVVDMSLRSRLLEATGDGMHPSPMPRADGGLEVNRSNKIRDDLILTGELLDQTALAIHRTLLPEVQRAFSFRATGFEQIKLVRYPVGGVFKAHRDNDAPDCAHRRFAVTVNLDSGYDGGRLVFGEYDSDPVGTDPGGAVVFSCSLLHAVEPVTGGVRHALITFLT